MLGALYSALFVWLGILDQGYFVIVAMLIGISALYFVATRGRRPVSRVSKSGHGVLFVAALFYAIVVDENSNSDNFRAWLVAFPFVALVGLGLSSVIYSLWGSFSRWYLGCIHILTVSYGFLIVFRVISVFAGGHPP